ncbi:hypothetical protein WEI85_21355 [Actinomycetes bacterium KLBMP 9797]
MLFDNVTIRLLGSDDIPAPARQQPAVDLTAADLTAAASDGALAIAIAPALPLERVAEAHDRADAGARDRVLLTIPHGSGVAGASHAGAGRAGCWLLAAGCVGLPQPLLGVLAGDEAEVCVRERHTGEAAKSRCEAQELFDSSGEDVVVGGPQPRQDVFANEGAAGRLGAIVASGVPQTAAVDQRTSSGHDNRRPPSTSPRTLSPPNVPEECER